MLIVFHLGCGNIRNVLFAFATKCREFRKMRSALTELLLSEWNARDLICWLSS